MIRISTPVGIVDVTDDHSLLLSNGRAVSPKDITKTSRLLHHELPRDTNKETTYELPEMTNKDKHNEWLSKEYVQDALDLYRENPLENGTKHRDGTYGAILYDETPYVFNNMLDAAKCCYLLSKEGGTHYVSHTRTCFIVYKNDPYEIKDGGSQLLGYKPMEKTFAPESDTFVNYKEPIPYEGYVYDLTTENHHFAAGVGNLIVHNTDSVFFTFNLQTPEGVPIRGKDALEITIEIAQEAGHLASKFLKGPHDLEYEKTFMPFCLLSKKRYVGMLYETDPNKGKRKEMGIVLKRRDNAPIVKDIYGGIIDILMKKQDIPTAIDFLKSCLQNIIQEKYAMDKLIITKSLRSGYKNPNAIAHKVLADRITARDPGNKPSSGDRIPFVYIATLNKNALQGEKIETPAFIEENVYFTVYNLDSKIITD
jgi:hypothetical protein